MLEISRNLVHKLIIRIDRRPASDTDISLMDLVKGVLCDQLHSHFRISASWPVFQRGGAVSSEDHNTNGRTASVQMEDGTMLWALFIAAKDETFSRRRWFYHVGLRSSEDSSAWLYYAKCRYDHTAGSISLPGPMPDPRDPFPDPLFFNDHFRCMCGKYLLPLEPSQLTHTTLPDFINYLQDETRTLPLILLCQPWKLSPEILQDRMLGSAIIYWCSDVSVAMRLNSILPRNMHTPWESVHVFVPVTSASAYHPLYTADDIRSFGDSFSAGLIQAYCQSLRAEDMRNFVTVDDIVRIRDRLQISDLLKQLKLHAADNAALQSQCEELNRANVNMARQIDTAGKRPDLDEYESLLNETMNELELLKNGMTDLTALLYAGNSNPFAADVSIDAPHLKELANALRTYLSCASRRK